LAKPFFPYGSSLEEDVNVAMSSHKFIRYYNILQRYLKLYKTLAFFPLLIMEDKNDYCLQITV